MTPEEFLTLVEQTGRIPEDVLEHLRDRVDSVTETVTDRKLASFLVENGFLTKLEARELLDDTVTAPPPAPADDAGHLALDDLDDLDLSEALSPKPPPTQQADLPADDVAELTAEDLASLTPERSVVQTVGRRRKSLMPRIRFRRPGRAKSTAVTKSQNPWDSPLMLVGGGALILLLLIAVTVTYLIRRGGGDQLLQLAEEDYRNGSYTQAIHKYNQFLERYPSHQAADHAHVFRALAQLRITISDTSDPDAALSSTRRILSEIEGSETFTDVRPQLASLLPDLAEQIARQAQQASNPQAARNYVRLGDEAFALVMNTNYVPRRLRPGGRVGQIRDTLALVTRDLQRDASLAEAMAKMKSSVDAGRPKEAYAARKLLITQYPSLASDEQLSMMTRTVAESEQALVAFQPQQRQSVRDEEDSPVLASLALAARQGPDMPPASDHPALVKARGAAFCLDAASGHLLWRREVGFNASLQPMVVHLQNGTIAVLPDDARQQVVAVDAASGELQWRLPIEQPLLPPTVAGGELLAGVRSGRLYVVSLESGDTSGHVQFPQELSTSPAVDSKNSRLYQVGSQASIYLLDTQTWKCLEVVYLGHAAGTVSVPPTVLLRNVVIAENDGTASCRLHVFSRDEDGMSWQPVQVIRLTGHVLTPPVVDGRRMVVATDRGHIHLLESGSADGQAPLIKVAELSARGDQELVRYPLLAGSSLWLAGDRLAKYQILAQSGRLTPQGLPETAHGDTFLAPPQQINGKIVNVRQLAGRSSTLVSATDQASGKTLWQTRLTMQPAGPPLVDVEHREVAVVTSDGQLFRFDDDAIRARVQDAPQRAEPADVSGPELTRRLDLDDDLSVFTGDDAEQTVLLYRRPSGANAAFLKWTSLPTPPSAPPGHLGAGLLVPTAHGQVHWLDPATGSPKSAPLQPELQAGDLPLWTTPCAVDGTAQFAIADRRGVVYLAGIARDPLEHLDVIAQTAPHTDRFASTVVCLKDHAIVVDASGRIIVYPLPSLDAEQTTDLEAQVAWGPARVHHYVLLATVNDELVCLGQTGQLLWRVAMEHGSLAGNPIVVDERIVLASTSGTVWSIDAGNGETTGSVSIGQPLATGPVVFGQRLIVAAHDGTLLVLNRW